MMCLEHTSEGERAAPLRCFYLLYIIDDSCLYKLNLPRGMPRSLGIRRC